MRVLRRRVAGAALAVAALLTACVSPLPTPPSSSADAPSLPEPPAGGQRWRADPAGSQLRLLVFRGGRAAALGHNHVLTAPHWDGWLWLPAPEALAQGRAALQLRLDALQIDAAAERAALGPAFARQPSAADIAGTRANMLSERGLDALRYPTVNVEVEGLQGEGGHWAAALRITLHGQQRRYWVPVRIEPEGKAWRVRLELALAQSDFGLQPFSVLGGLLAVQDVLQLRAELRFVPA